MQQEKERRFTDEEFDIMIEQLVMQKSACFDMLCTIVNKTLHDWVVSWCNGNKALKNEAEDIMQELHMKFIKQTVTKFLLRKELNGEINRNPDGFKSWMFKVAKSFLLDKARKCQSHPTDSTDEIDIKDDKNDDLFAKLEDRELLKASVAVILNSDSQSYIVMTWLAMCIYILDYKYKKIESNHRIYEVFFDKTLNDMFDILLTAAEQIPWLVITEAQYENMTEKLNKMFDENRTYGELSYREFLSKTNPLATISDWENRMNNLVKRVIEK